MSPALDVPVVPLCGLYRTTRPVPGHPDTVPSGRLVYFHNHSPEGPPLLLLPAHNQHNRWHFHSQGYLVPDLDYLSTLQPLKREGFYRVREHFHPTAEQIVNKNALAQLGYNIHADPILFFPTLSSADNGLLFPAHGLKIGRDIYDLLDPIDVQGPHIPAAPRVH